MSHQVDAFTLAQARVAAVRDDPASRVALLERLFHGPTGRAPRHVPFRLAALSFMRWQARRGVLNPIDSSQPGSVWWRAVNERLLRDGCEAVGLLGGLSGDDVAGGVSLGAEGGVALVEAVVEVAVGGLAERGGLALESVGADVAAELVLHFGAFPGGTPLGVGG